MSYIYNFKKIYIVCLTPVCLYVFVCLVCFDIIVMYAEIQNLGHTENAKKGVKTGFCMSVCRRHTVFFCL